ncbi:MAG TPA: glycosyltransferase [Polyangiales bacterium]
MLFVVPGPEAPISGGNRYNDALIGALRASRVEAAALNRDVLARVPGPLWVDSLYLTSLTEIRALAGARPLGLLAHSLPSQLARAAGEPEPALEERERAWLAMVERAVAPSDTMRGWLIERAPSLKVRVVEPGVIGAPDARREGPLRALMIANLLPNKGVLPFLEALAARLRPSDVFTLRIIGRADLASTYAARCRALAEPRIVFAGGLPFETLLRELARSHVLVSASRSESYGMALADARACGCVVLARDGGHAAALADVVDDDDALADALLSLVRDERALAHRLAHAQRTRLPPRGWEEVAHEFLRAW